MYRLCRCLYWVSVSVVLVVLSWSYAYLPTQLRWMEWHFSKEVFFYAVLALFFVLQLFKQSILYMCRRLEKAATHEEQLRMKDLVYLIAVSAHLFLGLSMMYICSFELATWSLLRGLGFLIYLPIGGILLFGATLLYKISNSKRSQQS